MLYGTKIQVHIKLSALGNHNMNIATLSVWKELDEWKENFSILGNELNFEIGFVHKSIEYMENILSCNKKELHMFLWEYKCYMVNLLCIV